MTHVSAPPSAVRSPSASPPPDEPMMVNGEGHYVPARLVPPAKIMEDQMVRGLVDRARVVEASLAAFRELATGEVDAFIDLLADKYGAKRRGGVRGNVTFTSFDETLRVQVATGDFIAFGPELQIAKSLIDECLTEWSEGTVAELKALVNGAFDVGKEGKVRTDQILGLRRVAIDHPKWTRAMEAINDAIRVTSSRRYVRFHIRDNPQAEWRHISLDLAGAGT